MNALKEAYASSNMVLKYEGICKYIPGSTYCSLELTHF